MADAFHPPIEEYLEAIHELEEEGITVIQARLAERLGHTPPSVSEMIRRLRTDGHIAGDTRTLELTDTGRAIAESVVRKHRLAERLLHDVIGLDWHKTHIEAGRWEHVISDEVEQKLIALLGNPQTCPHGNPMPGAVDTRVMHPLAELSVGSQLRLERVTEQVEMDYPSLAYLGERAFVPGTEATIVAVSDEGIRTLKYGDRVVELSPWMCEQLFFTVLERAAAVTA